LILNGHEDPELMSQTSDLLSVAIANYTMCKALNANLNMVDKIIARGKRCDFSIVTPSSTSIYEARGRSNARAIKAAVASLPAKKRAHQANFKFGVVSHLPRRTSHVSVHLFDPPGEDIPAPTDREMEMRLAAHYLLVSRIAKQPELVYLLAEKLRTLAHPEKQLPIPETYIDHSILQRVSIPAKVFNVRPAVPRKRPEKKKPTTENIRFNFNLAPEVVEHLKNWNVNKLLSRPSDDLILAESRSSIASDGSILSFDHVKSTR